MRCPQFIGLNPWADYLLSTNKRLLYTQKIVHVLLDGTEDPQLNEEVSAVPKTPVDKWYGMNDDEGDLCQCTLLDDTNVTEYVQASPRSSGPCIFIALKNENGEPIPGSLWSDYEITNC